MGFAYKPALNAPCGKFCPDRTMTCRATCEKWAEYEKKKKALYVQRVIEWQGRVTYSEDHERNARRSVIHRSRRPGAFGKGKP